MAFDLMTITQIVSSLLGAGSFVIGVWKYKQATKVENSKVELEKQTAAFKEGEIIRSELREDYDRLKTRLDSITVEHDRCQRNLTILRDALIKAGIKVEELES